MIQARYPQAKVNILGQGIAPGAPAIKRYSISFNLSNATIKLNLGENLTLMVDDVPREVLMYISLLHPVDVKATIQIWLKDIQKYLKEEKIPLAKDLARRYLGHEEKAEKKKNALYIHYDLFFVIVTPGLVFLCLRSNNRVIYNKKIENKADLEDFFKKAEFYAKSIRKGDIK